MMSRTVAVRYPSRMNTPRAASMITRRLCCLVWLRLLWNSTAGPHEKYLPRDYRDHAAEMTETICKAYGLIAEEDQEISKFDSVLRVPHRLWRFPAGRIPNARLDRSSRDSPQQRRFQD